MYNKSLDSKNANINNYVHGTLQDVPNNKYDCILYIDVLEHISNDYNEISKCLKYLNDNGKIIVLAPAYNFLFSNFDQSVGHFRRYNKRTLYNLEQKQLKLKYIYHLDTIGLILNLLNKFVLKKPLPNGAQIILWDKLVIPFSKFFDRLFKYSFGRTIVGIYEYK